MAESEKEKRVATWEEKVKAVANICCRDTVEALKALITAWRNRTFFTENLRVEPVSRVILYADPRSMIDLAIKSVLNEMNIDITEISANEHMEPSKFREVVLLTWASCDHVMDLLKNRAFDGKFLIVVLSPPLENPLTINEFVLRVHEPGPSERGEALRVLLDGVKYDIDLRKIIEMTEGLYATDLINLVKMAVSYAFGNNRDVVKTEDFIFCLERIIFPPAPKVVESVVPDDMLDQMYMMAISEYGQEFEKLIRKINIGQPLDRKLEILLAKCSFILLDDRERRIIRLMRAKKAVERIRSMVGGGGGADRKVNAP
ncbi:MAG: hypothetical protein ACTSXJ_00835 [Candidatus Baldrarchaeia archaeon]|mgnify:CR=1 FL=1